MDMSVDFIEIIAPENGAVLSLHTAEQRAFFVEPSRAVPHEADPTPNKLDNTEPAPVRFRWKAP
ncbi:MAG: hypothetical protein J6Q81_02775, partial [Lentisphaeria bacterium]|nr:hypothetical protein [Lentisphaeria bacterium]